MQEQEKELFGGYEIKNWDLSPRIYKIIAASAVFNLLAVMVFAQTNMLTRKGCDSPLVSSVCQVLDMVYVGSALLGTNGDFVNKDYEKTELEDAEITYIDVSGQAPPLEYPEGYFAIANRDELAALQNTDFSTMPPFDSSGFPANSTFPSSTDLMGQPQVTPTPNNNAVQGTVPDKPFDFGGGGSTTFKRPKSTKTYTPKPYKFPKAKSASPSELPKLDGDDTAENDVEDNGKGKGKGKKDEKEPGKVQPKIESESVADFRPNKKPLEDFAKLVLDKRSEKNSKLDLTKAFTIEVSGVLTEEGKLDPKKTRYKSLGDEEMGNVAREAIEAISDSKLFYYLKSLGVEKVTFTLEQNEKQISAVIKSSQASEERARTISSGFNGYLALGKVTVKEEELKTLLDSAKAEPQGKNFVLNFVIPKQIAQDIIKKKLDEAEAKAKEKEKEPNSTAQNTDANQKTVK